jgi:hypothetical protein
MPFRRFALVLLIACNGSSATPDAHPDAVVAADAHVDEQYRCDLADCSNGFARTCNDDPQTLDCTMFGASCGSFSDYETNVPFNWCTCGSLAEGDGFCLGGRYGVTCFDGLGGLTDCGAGQRCVSRPTGPFGIGCECNNLADGICPGLSCGGDPDCASCTPSCTGKSCGDNGCGGECGTCDFGDECSPQGTCETICVPNCTGRECGSDGCGGTCGTCEGTCGSDGQCQGTCVPSCSARTCGNDGCGGSCGTCSDGLSCTNDGKCDCGFFDQVQYTLTLAPQNMFPTSFSYVGVNVSHIAIDGTAGPVSGEFLGFTAPKKPTFTFGTYGCKPKLRVKRNYALSGKSCVADEIVVGRTSITIPAPIVNPDGNCTAPPL